MDVEQRCYPQSPERAGPLLHFDCLFMDDYDWFDQKRQAARNSTTRQLDPIHLEACFSLCFNLKISLQWVL